MFARALEMILTGRTVDAVEAERFVSEGDYLGASRKAAYAIVLREIKSKDVGPLREELKAYAMASPRL